MAGFGDRMHDASAWESKLLWHLRVDGWTADEFGQALLSEPIRDALKSFDTSLRWMPDLIAVRDDVLYLVDAKCGHGPNHAIESASLAAMHDFYVHFRVPVVVCWRSDQASAVADCVFTWELLADGSPLFDGRYGGRGSGTPFKLWPKDSCRSFESVFGVGAVPMGPETGQHMAVLRLGDA